MAVCPTADFRLNSFVDDIAPSCKAVGDNQPAPSLCGVFVSVSLTAGDDKGS